MSVKIKVSQVLRQFTKNRDTVEVNGGTVGECLDDLIRRFPDTKKWLFDKDGRLLALMLIKGESIHQKELDRPVTGGDELHLVLVFGGG